MRSMDHLEPETAAMLELPTDERVMLCKTDRWVGYTRATQIMNRLDQLLVYPKSLRMPSVLIVGRSGNCVFRAKLDTHSTANWTSGPAQTGHRFRSKLDSLKRPE